MAPFGPVPAMVGNETSFSAQVWRRKVSSASTVSISVSAPGRRLAVDPGQKPHQRHRVALMRGAGAFDLGDVLHRLEQADGIVAAHRLAAGGRDQAAQGIGRGGAVERDRMRRACASSVSAGVSASGSSHVGGLLEMVARQIGELAVVDEHGGAAVLRHQRVGQRQRRMRDVGAADVEGPGHRVRIRQHQRIDAELVRSRAGSA